MGLFGNKKKLKKAETKNKIYKELRQKDRATIKKLASDGTRHGSSESAKVLRSMRKGK